MNQNYLFNYFTSVSELFKAQGRLRTAESYASTLGCLRRFLNGKDIRLDSLDSQLIEGFQYWLTSRGLSRNSSSFYLRVLRALCRRAIRDGVITAMPSFGNVYTGNERTAKRALPLSKIRQIRNLTLMPGSSADFARDMFMLSFYMRGMSFIDMASLLKNDLQNGRITYRRHKTGQVLSIKWTDQMQRIADRHSMPASPYLLPIISGSNDTETRRRYLTASSCVNYHLKKIGIMLNLKQPLTMYVARHSWASIARSKNIPISVISEGMGHGSETTTRIYLASLNNSAVDRANSIILRAL